MTPHYYGLNSRLGLQYEPVGSTELNIGVEDGAKAIITPDFLAQYPGSFTHYNFPQPTQGSEYWHLVASESNAAAQVITQTLQQGETQIVLGGDHSVTFVSLKAVAQRINLSDVAYIQIDAHPDLNTVASSPSGNFHGMYVRALVDTIGVPVIDHYISKKLPTQNIWYFGNLSFDPDPEEQNFLHAQHIRTTSVTDVLQNQRLIYTKLNNFLQQFKHTHISFDIDSMDASVAPATGIPCSSGFLLDQIEPLITLILEKSQSISFDLVEVNPHKSGAQLTIATAQQILSKVLSS